MRGKPLKRQAKSTPDESGSQFRRLLDKLPAGAYTCDAAGLITYFNHQAVQLWGREPKLNDPVDRFCGSFRLFSAEGLPIAHDQCWMALALKTGQDYNRQEIIIERPDGSRLAVLAHANPIRDQRRVDEAQALLAAIVESSEDAIVSKSLDGRILSWNGGAERLFGYTAQEAVGSMITLIIPPESHDEERSILARLRRGERIEHFETVRVSKAGRRFTVSVTISPIRDSTGRIIGASKVARDITVAKQAEEALLATKNELAQQLSDVEQLHEMSMRLSTTFDLSPILEETVRTAASVVGADRALLALGDPEQNQLHVGASLGLDEDFLKMIASKPSGGSASATCFHQTRRVVIEDVEIDPVAPAFREAARQAGFRGAYCTPLSTRFGKTIGVLSMYFPHPFRPSDRETRLVDLCARQAVDFIENARLYRELRDADRRKDEFLAMLAHELRNPLAPISSSLQILRLSDEQSPTVEHVRAIMERQVNQLIRLVDDLLEVSRISRGQIELRKEPVDLVAVVANAVETSRPLIDAAGHQLAITISPEPMPLEADAVRLSQVIANLLNNAAKYTEKGGQIWLTARPEGGHAVVSVRDTGLGIQADMLSSVFDMFAQVDRTLDRAQGGLGIGLSLAKNLVQMHGGHIEAHSDGLGKGSEFVVRLPLAPDIHRPAGRVSVPRSSSTQLPVHRVLVVDDTKAAAYLLGKLLEAMGQQVSAAHDATSALESLQVERPDIIISDIAMPDVNGYELARRLRQDPSLKDVVLVALTGYGQESDKQRAKDAGFDYHLVKPVSLEALQEMLASLPTRPNVLFGSHAPRVR